MDDQQVTLSICVRCRDGRETDGADLKQRGGRRLSDAVIRRFKDSDAALLGVHLRGVQCMSQCKRPCTIALSGPDRFTYLFGDLDPELHALEVLNIAATYARAESGFLPRQDRPEVLRGGILGRIPPIDFDGELVAPLSPSPTNRPTETSA